MQMKSPLHDFLAPDSIAIVGASANPTKRGYKAITGLLNDGYAGAIYPINPKANQILGIKAYASLYDLPVQANLALICTPAKTVPDIVEQCGANGIKGAVILASGFGEVDDAGIQLEQDALASARRANVRIVGPNTSGFFNLHKKVNLLALDNVKAGNIGIISQSGNMLLALALEAEHNGHIGFSTYVGPGNQIDVGFADYLRFLGEEKNTRVAALYVEGFKNGREFLEVAKETVRIKPVVVYKSGSTNEGRQSASSHTGALAGSYGMTVNLLRQSGVSVVEQSDEILPVAEGLGLLQHARGNRVAVLADGGGQATIASDRLSEADLVLSPLGDKTRNALGKVLLPQASLANPVDVAGSTDASPGLLYNCLEILAADECVDMVLLVGMFGGYGIRFTEKLQHEEMQTAVAIADLSRRIEKPLVIYSLYTPVKPDALIELRKAGLPVYGSIEHAVRVLAALAERGNFIRRAKTVEPVQPLEPLAEVSDTLRHAQQSGRDLFEYEAGSVLRSYGITVPRQMMIRSKSELSSITETFGDLPLAMKVVSRDILHKSDSGGVKLNLRGEKSLQRGYDEILSSCKTSNPEAEVEGVLLTPMAGKGVEVIIGAKRDPIFGPVLMFGLGGVFVEILEDVVFRSIPLSLTDALSMISQIKAKKILEGARGGALVDKEALAELISKVSLVIDAHPEIAELDLNPVVANSGGCEIVDTRVIVDRDHSARRTEI